MLQAISRRLGANSQHAGDGDELAASTSGSGGGGGSGTGARKYK
jgi:hypothetical protein